MLELSLLSVLKWQQLSHQEVKCWVTREALKKMVARKLKNVPCFKILKVNMKHVWNVASTSNILFGKILRTRVSQTWLMSVEASLYEKVMGNLVNCLSYVHDRLELIKWHWRS